MKLKVMTFLSLCCFSIPVLAADSADPGVFVTLTRQAQPESELPTTVETIRPETFQAFDSLSAGDAISRATSVQVPSKGKLGSLQAASIRGASSAQTLVLIDGRPYSGAALNSADLSEIPVEQIERIEIVRGGVSALYGPNAMGGVINIITKRPSRSQRVTADANYEVGSYGRQAYRFNAASHAGPLDFSFFGDKQWESGFRDNSDARQRNVGGNVGLSLGAAGKLTFDVSSFHADAGVPGQISPDIPWNQYNNSIEKQSPSPLSRQLTDTNYVRTSYSVSLPLQSQLTANLFGQQREAVFDLNATDLHQQSKGGDLQLDLPLGFAVGGNFIRDREDEADHVIPTNSFTAGVESWSVFIQETFRWKMFTLIPAGRYDHNSIFGETKNPRVQLIADATPWLRFSGSAARSFRAPTIDDLFFHYADQFFSFDGNPNLRPESAWTYDGGFELHNDSTSLKFTYFRADVKNLIQTDPITFSTVYNLGKARRQGAEFEFRHVCSDLLTHRVNYTYLSNNGTPPGSDEMVRLPYSPHHTVNDITTLHPLPWLQADNVLRFVGGRFAGYDETGTKLGGTFLWDLQLAATIRQAQIYFGASDLLNKRYEESAGYPLPGRTYFGGVRCHFGLPKQPGNP